MDFERKMRNITYHAPACKMYLRHDFEHTCAYCGIIEETISPTQEIAEDYFEKDHFMPQSNKSPECHEYRNLFYACRKCNNKKDNVLLPLNPCKDNIYKGDSPHIWGGTAETDFCVDSSTTVGKKYIEDLELNSRYHVSIRQKQYERKNANDEATKILNELKENKKLDEVSLQAIESIMEPRIESERVKNLCGSSAFAVYFADTYEYLISEGYVCDIVLEPNELDLKITIDGEQYYARVLPSCDAMHCRIQTYILAEWKKLDCMCGVLRYIKSENKIHFYKIDFDKIDWDKTLYCVKEFVEL